jgi:ubiquinone/menaquinone biosynthesis C-methylase UbiE
MAGRAVAREPKEIVARGYDAIALRYAEWAGKVESPVMGWVRDLDAKLDDGADVLELGCGRGVPATRELARRHRVTGVDISAVQIELARHHVPEASFIQGDATELEVAPASVDAVVALFVFGHVPGRGATRPDRSDRPLASRRRPLPRHVRRGRGRGGGRRRLARRTHVLCVSRR